MSESEQKEVMRILSLIVAEFKSDPMSVQCFDMNAIVKPAIKLVEKFNKQKK